MNAFPFVWRIAFHLIHRLANVDPFLVAFAITIRFCCTSPFECGDRGVSTELADEKICGAPEFKF